MHKMIEKDALSMTGVCAICGPTKLKYRRKRNTYVCGTNWDNQSRTAKYRGTENYRKTFSELVAAQGGVCAICKENEPTQLDHCHDSDKVRGVLCRSCNIGLGHFRDSPERLAAALAYIAL